MKNDIGKANVRVKSYLCHGALHIVCELAIHNAFCTIKCVIIDNLQDDVTIYMHQSHG